MKKIFKNIFLSSLIALLLCGLMPVGTFAEDNIIASGSLELEDGKINASDLYKYLKDDLFKEHQTNAYVVWCKNVEDNSNSIAIDDQSTGTITLPNGLVQITAFYGESENRYSVGIGNLDVAVYYTLNLSNKNEYFIGDNEGTQFKKSQPETSTKIKLKSDANTNGFCLINNIGVDDNNKFYHDEKYTITTQTINGYFFTSINGDTTETTKVLTGEEINKQGIRVVYTKGTGLELRVQKDENIDAVIEAIDGGSLEEINDTVYKVEVGKKYKLTTTSNYTDKNGTSACTVNDVHLYGKALTATKQENGVSTYEFTAQDPSQINHDPLLKISSNDVYVSLQDLKFDYWAHSSLGDGGLKATIDKQMFKGVGMNGSTLGLTAQDGRSTDGITAKYGDTFESGTPYDGEGQRVSLGANLIQTMPYQDSSYVTKVFVEYETEDGMVIRDEATFEAYNSRKDPIVTENMNNIPLIKSEIESGEAQDIYARLLAAIRPDDLTYDTEYAEYRLVDVDEDDPDEDDPFDANDLLAAVKANPAEVSFRVEYTNYKDSSYNPSFIKLPSGYKDFSADVQTVSFKIYDTEALVRIVGLEQDITEKTYNGEAVEFYAEAFYFDENKNEVILANSKDQPGAFKFALTHPDSLPVKGGKLVEVGDYFVVAEYLGDTVNGVSPFATHQHAVKILPSNSKVTFEVGDYTNYCEEYIDTDDVTFNNLDAISLRARNANKLVINYSGLFADDIKKVAKDFEIEYDPNDPTSITLKLSAEGLAYLSKNYGIDPADEDELEITSGERAIEHNPANAKELNVVAPTCTEQGYTEYECDCGEKFTADFIAAKGHNFGDWKVTKQPTTSKLGEKVRECNTCGEKEVKNIAKLPSSNPNYAVPNTAVK